ncbi:hypothetical protein CHGG_00831 [Chaetomium globosum CBS 148.51]|jgi:cell division septum initiation protein DivIVA|uniref:Uncharacterized protein n=1 Tax=Chaetomium globosum (strain ATCC 6205 / CBS 148.51 / DSM 1962 / NBRC 6347 / NRRL 1970) TaxID=306901 RepID=Q2HG23_CHAGB|nr:uncharacterized protein CHGG_00831 [Chaetomium globosum CBS 148.51]EAQ92596.1 hypothetical protein CHGG_00831 [Chaetomium globosum CBS 148.51]
MMRQPYSPGSGLRLCQGCGFVSGRQSIQPANRSSVALQFGQRSADMSRTISIRPAAARYFTTSQPCRKVKRSQEAQAPDVSKTRFGRTAAAATYQPPGVEPAAAAYTVRHILTAFLGPGGIPSEEFTLSALRALAQIEVRQVPDAGERRSDDAVAETRGPASQLLGLDDIKAGEVTRPQRSPSQRSQDAIDQISDAAYTIVTHQTVVITRTILAEYVQLEARLGRAKNLPQILDLYASKPKPKMVSNTIKYVERNPSKAESAVDPAVADMALDAAIEAKDLGAAIGILETTYASKAYLRSKLIKKALLPSLAVTGTPVGVYYAATQLAQLQHALEPKIATGFAFAGAICYVGFTATIGAVAHFTANDQMKRVTWALGTPLRHRWLYEEERAALDKIACSFGFSEEHRYGEEEGEEFLWLREYILNRSMILDAVDLMPGMN